MNGISLIEDAGGVSVRIPMQMNKRGGLSEYPSCPYAEYTWDDHLSGAPYDGSIKIYRDPNGKLWQYEWFKTGEKSSTYNRQNLWKITDPLGKSTFSIYGDPYNLSNKDKVLLETTDASGHITKYEYESDYDIQATTVDPTPGRNLRTCYSYDTYGNQTLVTDPYGNRVQTDYDSTYQAYPVRGTNLETNVYTAMGGYDALGRVGWTKAARGAGGSDLTTQYQYDTLGRLLVTTNPWTVPH